METEKPNQLKSESIANSTIGGINLAHSHIHLSLFIGVLGISLPFLLWIFHGGMLGAISDYYYSNVSIILTSILVCFGFLLISYKGYTLDDEKEFFKNPFDDKTGGNNKISKIISKCLKALTSLKISENAITHIAGFLALLVAFCPTLYEYHSNPPKLPEDSYPLGYPLYINMSNFLQIVHLVGAGLFFLLMGYIALSKFPLSEENKCVRRTYRILGSLTILVILVQVYKFIVREFDDTYNLFQNDTFVFETLALLFFGSTWLLRAILAEKRLEKTTLIISQAFAYLKKKFTSAKK